MAGAIRKAFGDDNKLSRKEARGLNKSQLAKAILRAESNPDLRIGGGAQNYANSVAQANPVPSGGGSQAGANTGGNQGSANTGSQQGPAGDWRQSELAKYVRTADMYGMGTNQQGVFSGASWNQMKDAGYSDDQIRDLLGTYEGSDLMRGKRVDEVLNNYDTYKMPNVPDMPGFNDPRSGDDIGPSYGSRPDIFFMPVNTEGVNNMFGNPLGNGIGTSSVIGDGKDWTDPANAGELSNYYTRGARMAALDGQYAMSSANPNLRQNMNAFIDSGHRESLLTGRTPTADPSGWSETYPSALGGLTPWSQAYANQLNYTGQNWMPGGSKKSNRNPK